MEKEKSLPRRFENNLVRTSMCLHVVATKRGEGEGGSQLLYCIQVRREERECGCERNWMCTFLFRFIFNADSH